MGFGGQQPVSRPIAQPFFGQESTFTQAPLLPISLLPAANALNYSVRQNPSAPENAFAQIYATKSGIWTARDWGSKYLNSVLADKDIRNVFNLRTLFKDVRIPGQKDAQLGGFTILQGEPPKFTYSELLNLGERTVQLDRQLNWNKFRKVVKGNTSTFINSLKPGQIGEFFNGRTVKDYTKELLIKDNFKTIQDLFTKHPNPEIGTGLLRIGSFGLIGFDILKNTHDTYLNAKAKEDGSLGSQFNTFTETAGAFAKYSLRDAVAWEAANVGIAFGKALMPLAVTSKRIPIFGILLGALFGAGAQFGLDPLLKTGAHDPAHQEKKQREAMQQNPFMTARI